MSTQPFNLSGGGNLNPTGTGLFLPPPTISGVPGQTPRAVTQGTGGPGDFNFGNSANPTPPMPPASTNPYAPANNTFAPAPAPPTLNPGQPAAGTPPVGTPVGEHGYTTGNTATGYTAAPNRFQNTFGSLSQELAGFLNNNAGYNSAITEQTVAATNAAAQQNITLGLNNLKANLAASGISPNSSVAALEESNYMTQAQTQLNAIDAQEFYNMWSQSMAQETSVLETMAPLQAHHQLATSPLSMFEGIASGIGSLVGGASFGGSSGEISL